MLSYTRCKHPKKKPQILYLRSGDLDILHNVIVKYLNKLISMIVKLFEKSGNSEGIRTAQIYDPKTAALHFVLSADSHLQLNIYTRHIATIKRVA